MSEMDLKWTIDGLEEDVLEILSKQGLKWFRLRVFNRKDGLHGLEYATKLAVHAQSVGLTPYVNLFLSDRWATAIDQPATADWDQLSFCERRREVRKYTRDVVTQLKASGVSTSLYQIGNEIDYGLCGEFTRDTCREDTTWMRSTGTWSRIAALLEAAMAGVREADPKAKFIVHIAHWFNVEFASGFFRYLDLQNIDFDFVGISYYPTSGISEQHFGESNDKNQIHRFVNALNTATRKRVIFAEYAYPSCSEFHGPFAQWNKPAPEHPLSREGQAAWLTSFLEWCYVHPGVAGAFYWSPEYYSHEEWSAFSLFDRHGRAKPALNAFSSFGHGRPLRLRRKLAHAVDAVRSASAGIVGDSL